MEINNINNIIDHLKFEDVNDFYYIQIIKRKKDGHNVNGNNKTRLIKSYCVKNKQYLLDKEDEIIKLSNLFNARVYIHMSPRNTKQIMEQALVEVPTRYNSNHYNLINIFDSLCGKTYNKKKKTFLIDIDKEDLEGCYIITKFMFDTFHLNPILINRSVSGLHFIYKPFNVKIFKDEYPNIDVQKNNPTLLYYNKINK